MSSCYRHGWVRRHFFPILLAHSHLLSLTFPAVPSAHFLFSAHSVPFLLLLCISPCSSSFPSPIIHPIIPARQPLFHLLLTMFKQVIQVATNSMKSQFSPQPSSSKHSANFHRYSTLFSLRTSWPLLASLVHLYLAFHCALPGTFSSHCLSWGKWVVDGGGGGGWHCGEKHEIRMKCGVTDMATIVCGSQLQSLCTCHTA